MVENSNKDYWKHTFNKLGLSSKLSLEFTTLLTGDFGPVFTNCHETGSDPVSLMGTSPIPRSIKMNKLW